ncbi:MAG: SDR family NAD(P)-dependent oxidoreductase [Candidatus Acidiferrales bacterium]
MFLDLDYSLIVSQPSATTASAKLCDGTATLIKAEFGFSESERIEPTWDPAKPEFRQIALDADETALKPGATTQGNYQPDHIALENLLRRFGVDPRACGRLQASALLWSSYSVGMEQPGLRALFRKLVLTFQTPQSAQTALLSYETKVRSVNAFGLLCSEVQLRAGERQIANGEIQAFVIPRNRTASLAQLAEILPSSSTLEGRVAVVAGASRGLGSMLAAALASQGCNVFAVFKSSESEARDLQESSKTALGRVILARGDASELAWCDRLRAQVLADFGRLDFLVCNACPPLLPLRLEGSTVTRINSYFGEALALVSTPMAVFSPALAESSGWAVLISSVFVETTPQEWPHYVAVKCAAEGLMRVAAAQYPNISVLLVRPSRLQTDLTNGPSKVAFGREAAMPPEVAAATIVRRLVRAASSRVEVLIP